MAYFLAVLAAIVYGSADFLGGLASRRTSTLVVVALSQTAGLAIILGTLVFFPSAHVTNNDIAWGAAAGGASALGLGLLYYGLAIGVMSIVAPITAVFAALVPLAVGIVQGERPTIVAFVGVAMALVAIFLVSQTPRGAQPHAAHSRSIVVALAAGVVIGFFLVALDSAADEAGLWPLVVARFTSIVLVLPIALARGMHPPRNAMAPIVAGGALDMIANILYVLAVARGMLTIVATLVSLYPAATIILARLVYHERLQLIQRWGVVCAIAAVLLIVAGS